ncbi:MAG TPA: phosphodiester glycosidase family protein [Candidatus Onthocola stercorigallinarum]|nr:phosphodiester glycosidase family protein [Candidatus Onthocola stercorigallinarum]
MKVVKIVGKTFSFIGITLLIIVLTLILTIYFICHGPSKSAQELFVTTILETGQLKFLANVFMSDEDIQEIVNKNSLKEMDSEVDGNLINVGGSTDKELIEIYKVSGNNYEGTMMVINDPSKISLATTYPWGEYGKELDKLVTESGAIAGINGGLYYSDANKGGRPLGVTVSNGEIEDMSLGATGLHLIGFDNENILRIIDISNMNRSEIENLIETEGIRDAVSFQEEASDANNHFVKLIINGEKRELNGMGSGANPRTAIGQREDGSVLFLVTDGRGKNGHLGATAADLIEVMSEYGAVNAANVDGGSSSTMYYNGKYLMTSVTFYYSNSSWRLPTAFVVKE